MCCVHWCTASKVVNEVKGRMRHGQNKCWEGTEQRGIKKCTEMIYNVFFFNINIVTNISLYRDPNKMNLACKNMDYDPAK